MLRVLTADSIHLQALTHETASRKSTLQMHPFLPFVIIEDKNLRWSNYFCIIVTLEG